MRVRLATNLPLPPLKAWFSLQTLPPTSSISQLKNQICSDIQLFCRRGLKKHDIKLVLDEFELLDEGRIDVLRDGDLIYVEQNASSNSEVAFASRKRKREDHNVPMRTATPAQQRQEVSSSGFSSDETSSEDSSSSESTSSDSDSDSDSEPPLASSKSTHQSLIKSRRSIGAFVPPGQGKATTHSRNMRRRRKKQHEKIAVEQGPEPQAVGVNAIPLGTEIEIDQTSFASTSGTRVNGSMDVAMSSLSNKNKRRGFRNGIGQNVPAKIVFPERTVVDRGIVSSQVLPMLISPSEKQEAGLVPSNMFVTSVDVEEGMHSKKRRKKLEALGYGESMMATDEKKSSCVGGLGLADIEGRWDSLSQITEQVELGVGTLLGWKALGINPATITPEMLLYTAQVVHCGEDKVTVRPLGPATFEGEEEEEASHSWDEIIGGQWRIIATD